MRVTLGELIESGRKAINEGVIGSLMIAAKDAGGKVQRSSDFVARFDRQKQADSFMTTARMEYPGIDKMLKSVKTGGKVELTLKASDARKLESY
jgi:hypothetical protein